MRKALTRFGVAACDESARQFRPPAIYKASLLLVNIAFALQIAHVFRSPAYPSTGELVHLLPWVLTVSSASSILALVLASRVSCTGPRRTVWATDLIASLVPFLLAPSLQFAAAEHRKELFGLAYAVFILLKSVVLITWLTVAIRQRKVPAARWIFAVSLTVYIAITPWAAAASWTTGDEPHYLLLAHSLAFDHDFDVSNNYRLKDYHSFYPLDIADQHVVANSHGEQVLWHDVGTSVLLAPAYWAAGRTGAMIVINISAALLATAIFLLACQLGASQMAAFGCSLLYAFSSPLVYYSSQIYSEVLGASCCAWAAVGFLEYVKRKRLTSLAVAGVLLAVLPWLCIRFWMLAGALGAVIVARLLATRKEITWAGVTKGFVAAALPMVISLGVFGAFDYRYFGTILPNAGYLSIKTSYPQFWLKPQVGILGMLLDRGYGLLLIAPVYVLAFAGSLRFSKRKWEAAAMLAPALAYMGFMSLSRYWTGGWCPPGRYILCSAVLLAPFAALVIGEERGRPLTVVLGLWSLLISFTYTALPLLHYPSFPDNVPGGLNHFLLNRIHIEPGVIFPSIDRAASLDYVLATCWIGAIAVCLWWLNPVDVRRSASVKVVFGVMGAIVLFCISSYFSTRRLEGIYRQTITSTVRQLRVSPKERFLVPIRIENPGPRTWSSTGRNPIVLSYKWASGENILPIEGLRTILPLPVNPNHGLNVSVIVKAPDQPGKLQLRITLVEEGVQWFMFQSHEYLGIPASVE